MPRRRPLFAAGLVAGIAPFHSLIPRSALCSVSQAKLPFDANKLYCSEILAIVLQNNDSESPAAGGPSVNVI